ncbi:LIF receptor subunit alpha b isoform X2 [Trichomycterus rosablanca]|uniref:LIF receptor subunit alpha b isoform X2 n=1 Tax=Trichomycterus rosablanca TaxID=2290929 RepID=UPI002F35A862
MALVYVWLLGLVLSMLVVPGQQRERLAVPEILRVYTEDSDDLGSWTMRVEWRDGSTDSDGPQKVTHDVQIFHTEQMRLVHNETIEVFETNLYQWNWTSPIPLQCTSHSVRLRLRDGALTGAWSDLYRLDGSDRNVTENQIYPQNHMALATEGIVFCCILKPERVQNFTSSIFTIKISNQTYVTRPVRYHEPSPEYGFDIICDQTGATFFTGYAPDVTNLTCETRDFRSVECHWRVRRPTGIAEEIKEVKYSINGRDCPNDRCILDDSIDDGVMNWTLSAENILGKMIIFDRADPKHRVRLRAPADAHTVLISARNATLQWKWDGKINSRFLSMICQVELNERIINGTFNGVGLQSAVLRDLHPFTKYTARVRCASREHFYKWGDWSDAAGFSTSEDVSEAVDLWVQVMGGQTYVVWKRLNANQSHGVITGYELVWGSSKKQEPINKSSDKLCHEIDPASAEQHRVISVSARNSVGVSPPSSLDVSNLQSDAAVNISAVTARNGGFDLVWELNPVSSCGYVVDWYPTYRAEPCAIQWKQFPSEVSKATIYSDFEKGVRYTLSVYACTSGVPQLLQRSEGYVEEQVSSGEVQNLRVEQHGSDILLSWDDVSKEQHRGFIKGYNVSYSTVNGNKTYVVLQDPSVRQYTFNLPPDTYTFTVKAFTSAGEGPGAENTLSMDPQIEQIIIIIMAVMAFTACILALVYRKRKCLESVLYPDIPKPHFSEVWLKKGLSKCQVIDKLLLAETEVVKQNNPEPPQVILDLQREHDEAQLLQYPKSQHPPTECEETQTIYCTKSEDPPLPEGYDEVYKPETLGPITVDFSYTEVSCLGIQDPTYNLTLTDLTLTPPANNNVVLVPGYLPQKQNI